MLHKAPDGEKQKPVVEGPRKTPTTQVDKALALSKEVLKLDS